MKYGVDQKSMDLSPTLPLISWQITNCLCSPIFFIYKARFMIGPHKIIIMLKCYDQVNIHDSEGPILDPSSILNS